LGLGLNLGLGSESIDNMERSCNLLVASLIGRRRRLVCFLCVEMGESSGMVFVLVDEFSRRIEHERPKR
jgi:hypothetical protein